MAMRRKQGFALLVAVIFMTVMLSIGLALGSLAFKQQSLASSALASQRAFYAADAGMECALYYDQRLGAFSFPLTQPGTAPLMKCEGADAVFPPSYSNGIVSYTANTKWAVIERLSLNGNTDCADVTVYKPNQGTGGTTFLFSQGYDVPCSALGTGSARTASRGLEVRY